MKGEDDLLDTLVHGSIILLFPPLLPGIAAKVKAFFAGRKGPPVLQLYFDIWKLLRKGSVLSRTTTWLFLAGPLVSVGAVWTASLFLPLGASPPVQFAGDFILFAYLLALSRFFTACAAMDTGSSFEGMGAARDLTFSTLAEPALLLGFLLLTRLSGSLSLSDLIATDSFSGWVRAPASLALLMTSWSIVLLAENCRIPFDDPSTHLELTMIHEVMVLDHSGPAFALILYGASLKFFLFAALLVRLFLPSLGEPFSNRLLFLAACATLAVGVGVVESTMARLRLTRVPQLLIAVCLLNGFGLLLLMR